jgi:hypothetical protein
MCRPLGVLCSPAVILAACGLVLSGVAMADTRRVPQQHATIQEAIDAAAEGDTILVAAGEYEGFMLLKAVSIRGEGGPGACLITTPVEIGTTNATGAVLDGLTIDGRNTVAGPGLTIASADIVVRSTIIRNWLGHAHAGGVLLTDSSSRLIDCTITGNEFGQASLVQEGTGGGGLAAHRGSPSLIRCTISDNRTVEGQAVRHAETHDGGHGGGLFFRDAAPTLLNCTIQNNSTGAGGSDPGCDQFFRNGPGTAGGSGGGIYMQDSAAVMINCLIADNTAGAGGNGGECPPQTGGNGGSGAGVYITGGSARLINCTVAGNLAGICGTGPAGAGTHGRVGGIHAESAAITIHNSILWANQAPEATGRDAQVLSARLTIGHSCIMGMESGFDGQRNFSLEPRFASAEGGDYRLSANSPCIDAGDTNRTPAWVTTDLAGEPRFMLDPESVSVGIAAAGNGGHIVDVGAYEFQGVSCYANCDASNGATPLTVDDFQCFINRFAAGDPRANCDESTAAPALNIDDFICFMDRFVAGCP